VVNYLTLHTQAVVVVVVAVEVVNYLTLHTQAVVVVVVAVNYF